MREFGYREEDKVQWSLHSEYFYFYYFEYIFLIILHTFTEGRPWAVEGWFYRNGSGKGLYM